MGALLTILIIIFLFLLFFAPILILAFPKTKKKERDSIQVDDLWKVAKTGDILLFSFRKNLYSKFHRLIFATEWTHVGILYFPPSSPKEAFVWEMTIPFSSEIKDTLTGRSDLTGPKLVLLKSRLQYYGGYCMVRTLSESAPKEELEEKFQQVFNEYKGVEFKFDTIAALLLFFEDKTRFFRAKDLAYEKDPAKLLCSEMVMVTYEKLGIIDRDDHRMFSFPHHYAGEELGNRKILEEYEVVL
jgi:hypothetical protein